KKGIPRVLRGLQQISPAARIGVVVYGDRGVPMQIQPLTSAKERVRAFLEHLSDSTGGPDDWEEDTLSGCRTAIERSEWKPYARKVVVLIGDSPPRREDFSALNTLVRTFHQQGGEFDAIDVAEEEHRRFEIEWWRRQRHSDPPM